MTGRQEKIALGHKRVQSTLDGNDRTVATFAIGRMNSTGMRLNDHAAKGQLEAKLGFSMLFELDSLVLVKHALKIFRGNARPFINNLQPEIARPQRRVN